MSDIFRVLVAEDEPRILKYISQKISNLDNRFEVVGTARNGMDAYAMIKELEPDVLFSDISMPVMGGLELSRKLKDQQYHMKTVIISGYRNFDYAQEALRYGVTDYLLKPIVDNELMLVLERIASQIIQDRNARKKSNIQAAVKGIYHHKEPSQNDKFFVVFVSIGNWIHGVISASHNYVLSHIRKGIDWDDIIRKSGISVNYYDCDGFTSGQKVFVFEQDAFSADCNELKEFLDHLCRHTEGYSVNICAYPNPVSLQNIHKTTMRLVEIVSKMLSPGASRIIPTDEELTEFDNYETILTSEQLNLFKKYIQSSRFDFAWQQMEAFVKKWDNLNYPQFLIENQFRRLIQVLAALRTDIDQDDIYLAEYTILSSIATCRNLSEALAEIWDVFESLLFKKSDADIYTKKTIEDIEAYLREHYTDNLSAEKVADAVGFHVVYLNRIFKKHKNVSLIKYLISYRIEKAKELIEKHPDWKLSLIGESVGYQDPYYFSRAFKKNTGQSPSEYRDSMMKKQS